MQVIAVRGITTSVLCALLEFVALLQVLYAGYWHLWYYYECTMQVIGVCGIPTSVLAYASCRRLIIKYFLQSFTPFC